MDNKPSKTAEDIRLAALMLMLEPAFVLARLLGLSLADLEHLVRTGYFRELRGRGFSLPQVASRLGKSLRTTTQLAREAELDPTDHSERLQLRRKLIRVLAGKGRLTERELIRLCPQHRAEDIRQEVASLIEQSLVESRDDLLALQKSVVEFVHGKNEHKLAVLRMYMQASLRLVFSRFFADSTAQNQNAKSVAMLRVLSFRAERVQLEQWAEQAYAQIAHEVAALDQEDAGREMHVVFAAVEHPEDVFFRKGALARSSPRRPPHSPSGKGVS